MKRFLLFLLLPFYLISQEYVVDLYELGKIIYQYDGDLCQKITRLSTSGEIKYEHLYHYDENERLISESLIGGLGLLKYYESPDQSFLSITSPHGVETWSNKDTCSYKKSNIKKVYDDKGRLIQKGSYHYGYDDQKLISVSSDDLDVIFAYNEKGRKIAKKTLYATGEQEEEYYIFLGKNEIGSLSGDGKLKWLRIPGLTAHPDLVKAIAIETQDAIYAPIYDARYNIVKLIDIEDGTVFDTRPDPFGQNLSEITGCPWTFCSKRYDPGCALVDFGYRHYDSELREWITLDPLMQDPLPYRYCFDNPMQYLDPDGRFVFVIPLAPLIVSGGALLGKVLLDSALIAAGTWLGYKAIQKGNEWVSQKAFQKNKIKDLPYTWEDLGWDPSKCPDKGFEWKGKGSPKSGRGNWVKGKKSSKEELHPDLEHPTPIGPHWDYHGPSFPNGIRIKPDGTWEHKLQ